MAELYVAMGSFMRPDWLAAAVLNSFFAIPVIFLLRRHRFVPLVSITQWLPPDVDQKVSNSRLVPYLPSVLVVVSCIGVSAVSRVFGGSESSSVGYHHLAWVLWIPVVEELVFRVGCGYVFRRWLGVSWGTYYSVLAFALIHSMPTVARVSALEVGLPVGPLVLAACCEILWLRFRSLGAIVAFHAACNFTVVIFSLIDARWLKWLGLFYL